MNYRTGLDDIVKLCINRKRCGCCKFYNSIKKDCLFTTPPYLWDMDRIRQACIEAGIAKEVK